MLGKLLGTKKMIQAFRYTCPACRKPSEVAKVSGHPVVCPHCHRRLRLHTAVRQLQKK
jgi:DNA-directed RNA polymerase subunit RPC12/RpoP